MLIGERQKKKKCPFPSNTRVCSILPFFFFTLFSHTGSTPPHKITGTIMLRRTARTVHTPAAQWTRTLCTATTRRSCLPLLHCNTVTTSIPTTTTFLTTGSSRLVAARGLLLSHTTRRYLQQNAFEVNFIPFYEHVFFSDPYIQTTIN